MSECTKWEFSEHSSRKQTEWKQQILNAIQQPGYYSLKWAWEESLDSWTNTYHKIFIQDICIQIPPWLPWRIDLSLCVSRLHSYKVNIDDSVHSLGTSMKLFKISSLFPQTKFYYAQADLETFFLKKVMHPNLFVNCWMSLSLENYQLHKTWIAVGTFSINSFGCQHS